MLMGNLAGVVAPATSRRQSIDGVILMKGIPYAGRYQVAQVTNSLDVGLGIPEGENAQQTGEGEV